MGNYEDYEDDYYGGFDNYVITTRSPGSVFFYVTIIYVVFSIFVMGPLVYLGRKWKKYRKARKRDKFRKESDSIQIENKVSDNTDALLDERSLASVEIQNLEMSQIKSSSDLSSQGQGLKIAEKNNKLGLGPLSNKLKKTFRRGKTGEEGFGSSSNSPFSGDAMVSDSIMGKESFISQDLNIDLSNTSSNDGASKEIIISSNRGNFSSLYDIPPNASPLVHRTSEEHMTLLDAVDEVLDDDYFADDNIKRKEEDTIYHPDEEGIHNVIINLPETNCRKVRMPLKKRRYQMNAKDQFDDEEEDEVPEDAFRAYYNENADEDEDEANPYRTNDYDNAPTIKFEANDITEEVTSGMNTWYNVIAFDKETRKLLKVALPSTLSTVISSILGAFATAMISVEIGAEAYTAYAMISLLIGITDTFIGGVESAESTLTAQAIGMENYFLAGQYFQMTTTLYIIIAIPTYAMWFMYSEWTLLKLQMGEDIAQIGGDYARVAVISYFVNGLAESFSTLLWSAEYGTLMTVIDTAFHLMYLASLWVLLYVYEMKDLVSVAWIGVVNGFLYGIFMFCVVYYQGILDIYWKGMFRNLALKNGKLVRGVLKMAIPLSIGDIMSYGEWEIFTFFSTTMGIAEVAAWSLGGAIWEILESMSSGFGYAAELRVAFHLGNGNPGMAKITAYKSLLYSLVWMSFVTGLFTYYSSSIVEYFTHDNTLIVMLSDIVVLISIGNVIVSLSSEAYYVLTAQGRPKITTWIYFITSWAISLPLSTLFVVHYKYGLQSVVTSIIIGGSTASLTLLYLVFTSNWAKISKKIIRKGREAEGWAPKQSDNTYMVPKLGLT